VSKHRNLLRPFALSGLVTGLVGSALGAVLLVRIDLSLGEVTPLWKQLHGQLQVFGFLVPLVIGFGTYLVPRMTAGNPVRDGLAIPSSAALALATIAAVATLATRWPHWAVPPLVAFGTIAGAACLHAPLRARRAEGHRVHERLLEIALLFLALGGLANAAAWLLLDDELPAGLAAAAWRLGIEGFAVGMVLAISARMLSGFLGIPLAASVSRGARPGAGRERRFTAAAWAWACAVALGSAAAIAGSIALEEVANIAFAAGAVPLSLQLGLAPTTGGPAIDRSRDPQFAFGARAAYALFAAGALVGAAASAADLAGFRVHSLFFDARRHLINIGFLLTLIATMAGRLAPGFSGGPLRLRALRTAALVGFPVSAVLRALEAVAGQWGPAGLLSLAAASGPLAALSLLALAVSIGATLIWRR